MTFGERLKKCSVCKLETEPAGGVEVRQKWHCAKCWMQFFMKRKAR